MQISWKKYIPGPDVISVPSSHRQPQKLNRPFVSYDLSMKKVFYTFLFFILCFDLSSFGHQLMYTWLSSNNIEACPQLSSSGLQT